jgi:lipopolysaccharide/colanic/teichoic acid biosynthesis glycosyltransferase
MSAHLEHNQIVLEALMGHGVEPTAKQTLPGRTKAGAYKAFVKRALDLMFSLCALMVLSPVLVVVASLIRIKLGTPVIFRQTRPGLDEKPFTLFKFRTMTSACDESGELLSDDARLTQFGRFLRATSIDELPELWNVARGDMSFVGPRPLLTRYLPYYRGDERLRSTVRPGITGLAQINGRNALTWDDRFKTDADYVNRLSFLLDVRIMMRTVLVVLNRKDVLVGSTHVLRDLDMERSAEIDSASEGQADG